VCVLPRAVHWLHELDWSFSISPRGAHTIYDAPFFAL
jgi:hypothetical protein